MNEALDPTRRVLRVVDEQSLGASAGPPASASCPTAVHGSTLDRPSARCLTLND